MEEKKIRMEGLGREGEIMGTHGRLKNRSKTRTQTRQQTTECQTDPRGEHRDEENQSGVSI